MQASGCRASRVIPIGLSRKADYARASQARKAILETQVLAGLANRALV